MGGKRTHIHLTTYPLNTQGFVEARGHRPYAVAVDLVKCLHAGVALYIAGGDTDGQDVQGMQGSSRAQATPMEVFTAEAAPDDVPRVTVHTKEELQDALYLTAAVEASQEAGQGGETSATEATSMSDDGADHTASASRPGGTHWVPQGENAGQEAMQVDDGAPLEGCWRLMRSMKP